MPKPPVLPTIDWKAVFESGATFEQWLAAGESADNRAVMRQRAAAQPIEPHVAGLLGGLARPVHVVAIAEDWCGDVVRHAPVLERMAQVSTQLRVRYISREQHKDVFARFLTNGGEAIPKFVFLNDRFVECGNWGPMPDACRELIARGKACGDVAAARKKVSALYEADPERHVVVRELLRLIDTASASAP